MGKRFWVIGGEYRDTNFTETTAPATALGPFPSYDAALRVWQDLAVATRPHAHVRYTIAADAARAAS